MERTGFEQWKPREVARLLALVETERRYYQEMVAALPVALAVLSPERAIVSTNKAFRLLTGMSGDELRQKNIEQIFPSDELVERIRSAHVHGDTGVFSISMGDRRFRVAAAPIRSWEDEMQPETLLMVDPGPAGLHVAPPPPRPASAPPAPAPSTDFSNLPAVIWQAGAESLAFTYAGGSPESILGRPASDWMGRPDFFSARIHPDDRAEVMALYESVIASGGDASAEFRALHASGQPVWVRETIHVPSPGAGLRTISGVLTAIGERREWEAQALAAGRIDAMRALASRLAHDLNNPLMIVSGYSEELLHALPADDPARADLAQVTEAARRMSEITGGLLGFTRSQAKPAAKTDLGEVMAALEPRLKEFPGEVEIAFPSGPIWANSNAEQLEDAIAALTAFAVEHTAGANKLSLTVHLSRVVERTATAALAPGLYAQIDISVPGEAAPKSGAAARPIFEALPPVTFVTRAYLNVRQWGGDISCSIEQKQGARFTILLPYVEAPFSEPVPEGCAEDHAPQQQPVMLEEPAAEPEPEPSLGTILVVEDEPGIRGLVRKILRRERYEVLEAGSAEEALTVAASRADEIDLLLTDVMLPGMGGRELAESLAAANPGLRVIYVSGFTPDEGVRTGQFPPGARFLQKPFTLSALVDVVNEALAL